MTTTETTSASGLPAAFADLEPFADWILETQPERYRTRLARTMPQMQAFYDAAFPRLADMIAYCEKYPIDDLPEDVKKLMYLIFSLIEVSFPVEVWRQGRVPDSGSASMDLVVEPSL
jgi:hypothetical protein